ncbi:hypothetical protein EV426DRAFT_541642, partial [Tirmania nivea]
WLKECENFLAQLLVLVHLTAELPHRGTELLSVLLRNSQLRMRNIYICHGQVLLLTDYNKTDSTTRKPKVIPYLLLSLVSQLLFMYIVAVIPFQNILWQQLEITLSVEIQTYLFT